MSDQIKGVVERKIFSSEQSGFGIYRIAILDENEEITIKGPLSTLEVDSTYVFTGVYDDDPRYGMQFKVEQFEEILPSNKDHVLQYLSGPSFPGVGIKSAEAIVKKYGEDVLNKIKDNPDFEMKVKGISDKNLTMICNTIRQETPTDEAINLMLLNGFSSKQALAVTKKYEDKTIEIIQENPYRLMMEINGIGFRTVDKLGRNMKFTQDHPYRLEALILDQYETIAFGRGDSFIYLEEFLDLIDPALYPYVTDSLASLIDQGYLVMEEERVYHHTQYEAEVFVSEFITDFEYRGYDFNIPQFKKVFSDVEDDLGLNFDKDQIKAIQEFLEEDIMVLTGGPGTGKSTLLSGVVRLLQKSCPWLHITLCAPTGRAAKRLSELTNVHSATVHSVLKWEPNTNTFKQNETNPLTTDVLIVDEFSMVDIWLLSNLLKASKHVKKILFVGDKDQLPSVGPGFVLGDLIQSKYLKTIFLEKNYRQEEGSEVVDLALKVKDGKFDLNSYHKDVKFFDSRYGPIHEIVNKVVIEALDKGYSLYDIQVLAPKYAGKAGIDTLNHVLQRTFNPESIEKKEMLVGSTIFREGDKILQLKNQPEDMVYNGDIGQLVDVEHNQMVVNFDGTYVTYDRTDFLNITHAYCISVHKAQGSEYPIIILLAHPSYGIMLSRRLYYTAMSRSSKSLILIGMIESFVQAAENQNESHRYTYLTERLENNY